MSAVIPYPTGPIEVEVAAGIGHSENAGVWDASPWGAPTVWGQADTSLGDWVDITCDVSELDLVSGASQPDGIVSKIETTTGSVRLHGAQYDPWAPTYPLGTLGPGVPLRARWRRPGDVSWKALTLGESDGWPYDKHEQSVAVPFVSAAARLTRIELAAQGSAVGSGDTATARVNRILDAAAWPATARDVPTAPSDPMRCVSSFLAGEAWDQLALVADTDLGIVWANRSGLIAFRPVGQVGQWSPVATGYRLTDTDGGPGTDICVVDYQMAEPDPVRNYVSIAHVLPAGTSGTSTPQIATNDQSRARYGRRDYSRQDLICDSDTWCMTVAQLVILGAAFPRAHPETAALDIRVDTHVADLLLGAEVSQTIDALVDGSTFHCVIVGWSVTLNRGELSGVLVLDDVNRYTAGYWDSAKWDIEKWGVA